MLLPPVVIECPSVEWPADAGPERPVELELHLDEAGRVVEVLSASGPGPAVAAARDAVRSCTFEPAREDGLAVAVRIPMTWSFRLEEPTEADRPAPMPRIDGTEAVGRYTPLPELRNDAIGSAEAALTPGSLGDPVRALQNLPGLARSPFDAGWILLRGGDPDDTATFVNGFPVRSVLHMGGTTAIVHPALVDSVRVNAGTPELTLGSTTAGTVDVLPADVTGIPTSSATLDLAMAQVHARLPTSRGAWAISARRSWLDRLLPLFMEDHGAATAPGFADATVLGQAGKTTALLLGSFDGGAVVVDTTAAPARIEQRSALAGLRTEATGEHGHWEGRVWSSIHGQLLSTEGRFQRLGTSDVGFRFTHVRDAPLEWTTGLEAAVHGARSAWEESASTVRTGRTLRLVPYAGAHAGDRLHLSVGARAPTYLSEGELPRGGLAPRARARFAVTDRFAIDADAGRTYQMPPDALHVGTAQGSYLPVEHADQLAIGFRTGTADRSWSLTGYARQGSSADYATDGNIEALSRRAHGLEGAVLLRGSRLTSRTVVQLTRSRQRDPEVGAWTPTRYDQPLRWNTVLIADPGRDWHVSSRFRYATGFPAALEPVIAFDMLTYEEIAVEPTARGRTPAPWSADLQVSRTWWSPRWRTDISLDLQNLTNHRVAEPTINGFDDSRTVYAVGLPSLPLVRFTVARRTTTDDGAQGS